ncbi:hypothetical protein GCM10020331_042000 [Ectobacillus funiculus]
MQKKMRNYIAALLFIAGVVLISITGWQFIDAKRQQKQSTAEAQEMLGKAKDTKLSRAAFQPQKDETIGMLRIPKIHAVLPIIEGTDPDDLKKGSDIIQVQHFQEIIIKFCFPVIAIQCFGNLVK